jgi:hypothetical protein
MSINLRSEEPQFRILSPLQPLNQLFLFYFRCKISAPIHASNINNSSIEVIQVLRPKLKVLISESLLLKFSTLLLDNAKTLICIDCPLDPPLHIVIDVLTSICIIHASDRTGGLCS